MNFGLVVRPLSGASDQKNHFCLNRFYISQWLASWSIFVEPVIKVRLGQNVPPSVTVVAALACAVPTKP